MKERNHIWIVELIDTTDPTDNWSPLTWTASDTRDDARYAMKYSVSKHEGEIARIAKYVMAGPNLLF